MSSTYRRMNIAGSAETRSDSGVIELTGRPSEAFFESLRQAERQKAEYPNDREELLASVRGPQDIGLRTLLSAICMIVVGVVRHMYLPFV
ncbi:hypothetical protein EON63_04935 [archaeon]|nr:MAG: hypothetical protein EON63_04935 [archaeon]